MENRKLTFDEKFDIKTLINEKAFNFMYDEIENQTKLVDDLGFDDLDTIEFIIDVEKHFGIIIINDDKWFEKIKTVQDVFNLVEEILQKN